MISARERTGLSDRLTSPQPGGRFLQRGLFIQSEYTLFLPSNCPTNQDHLSRWIEMMRGKKILAAMVNSNEFEVRDAEGKRVTGKEKAYEILRDLAVKDVPSRPSDLVELRRLIHRRVRGAD